MVRLCNDAGHRACNEFPIMARLRYAIGRTVSPAHRAEPKKKPYRRPSTTPPFSPPLHPRPLESLAISALYDRLFDRARLSSPPPLFSSPSHASFVDQFRIFFASKSRLSQLGVTNFLFSSPSLLSYFSLPFSLPSTPSPPPRLFHLPY